MQCLAQAAGTCLYTADWSLEAFQQVHTTAQAGHARQSAQRRFNFVPLGLGGRNVTLPRKPCNAGKFMTAITVMPETHSALLFAGHAHKPGRYKTWANHKHVATGSHNGSCTKGDFHQSPCLYMDFSACVSSIWDRVAARMQHQSLHLVATLGSGPPGLFSSDCDVAAQVPYHKGTERFLSRQRHTLSTAPATLSSTSLNTSPFQHVWPR